jgi:putative ABC transport system permease protein
MTVALLALRLVMLAALEEDYREIGVMKAIGMPSGSIRGLYTGKYLGLAAAAAVSGLLVSLPVKALLTANVTRYIGDPAAGAAEYLMPLLAVLILFMLIYFAVTLILRRFRTISAVDALRASRSTETKVRGPELPVAESRLPDLNIFLGLRDVVKRFRLFGLLLFIFILASGVTLIPVHFLTTLKSPDFIRYMGIGRADIRIDLRAAEGTGERFEEILAAIAADDEVERFAPHVVSVFDLPLPDGTVDEIRIESGEFTTFPLEYLAGRAPLDEEEIALSLLYSRDLELTVGDPLTLLVDGSPRELTVTGIYQDITNGGRTAKSPLAPAPERAVGYSLSLDLVPGSDPAAKVAAYSEQFRPARVTELEAYLDQTLGSTITGLSRISTGAVLVGTLVAVLITSLFLRMLITRDGGRIAIMRSLGFSLAALKKQYLTSAILLVSLGIGAGALLANTAGQGLVSFIWGFLGASRITFVIDPLLAYLAIPAVLACGVAAATVVSISGMRETTIAARVAE